MAAIPSAGILYRLGEEGHKVSEIAICSEAEVFMSSVYGLRYKCQVSLCTSVVR